MTDILFPIIYTEKAYEDPLFKMGYDTHMRMYELMKTGNSIDEDDIDKCFNFYCESYDANGTYEAIANCVWWLLVTGAGINNLHLSAGADALYKNKIDKKTFLKQHYLKDCENMEDENKKEADEFLDETDEAVYYLLQELNRSPDWSALAQYYIAIRYLFDLVKNDYSRDLNKLIGEEMMISFAAIGNQYADRIIQKGFDNLNGNN